jgi:membrane dipeptidase
MKIFDAHCDVLYKMHEDDSLNFTSELLQINARNLINGNNNIQCFALYVPERIKQADKFNSVIKMISLFKTKILDRFPEILQVKSTADILSLKKNEVGAILTVEGCDFIEDDFNRLILLNMLGVKIYSLTWNYGNLLADGVLESRNGKLSNLGRSFCNEINKLNSWIDVSHLSEKGFFDVINICNRVIASHSNSKAICNHIRNLSDDQIRAIVQKNGWIGITFVPKFLSEKHPTIFDVLKHIERLCELGAEKHIGFGSDFDGFDDGITNLSSYSHYYNLIDLLQNYYSEDTVKDIIFNNFVNKVKM